MKKALTIVIAVIMIFTMSACATSNNATSPSPSTETSVAPSTEPTPAGPAGPEVLLDLRVREALSLAIDREYINETIYSGTYVPATGMVPFGVPDATTGSDFREVGGELISSDFEANVAEAQQLLADAGFPNGEGFPVLEYTYNTNTTHQAIAEAVQQSWKENLNIQVDIAPMEWDVFQGFRKTDECQIARQGWLGDYADPATFFDLFTTDAGTNDGHYNSAKYDELVNSARVETDPAKRMDMYHQAEKVLLDDVGIIPIVFYKDEVLIQPDLTGVTVMGTGFKAFWEGSKQEITACVGSEPETLDPAMNQSVDGFIYINHLYEGIYRLNTDGSYTLGQAKSADIDADNVMTIVLRDDIKWSDGKPVTAEDFVYAWKRMMDPATGSPYSYVFGDFFKNGNAVLNKEVPADELSVSVVDEKTIKLELGAKLGFMKDLLAFPEMMPLRKDIVEANPDSWATAADTAVYNGRYILTDFAHEDKLVLEKNDGYWEKDTTKVTDITFRLMSDDSAILAAFKNKELDLCDSILTDERSTLMQTSEYHLFPQIGIYYLQMNNSPTVK